MRRPARSRLALALALALGCGAEQRNGGAEAAATHPPGCPALALHGIPAPRGVIFVLADTLRRDRLAAYGGPARTPAFDSLAEDGVLFTSVSSQAPWTKPSVATLFTGLYPSQHGLSSHPQHRDVDAEVVTSDVLAAEPVTLAEALSAAGFRTAAFVSNPWLSERLGFAQGFEVWDGRLAGNETPGRLVSQAGLAWLRELPDDGRPFFLYLHYMDAHEPFPLVSREALEEQRDAIEADTRPVAPAARREISMRARFENLEMIASAGVPANRALIEWLYDRGVEEFDAALALLVAELERIPAARETALVVTSDHGEALWARGWGGHGHGFFEDEIGVPLVLRWPGLSAEAPVDCPLGLIDLRSTLCDLLGVACGADQGRSLLDPRAPAPDARIVLAEGAIERPRHRAARDRRWKLVFEPDGRLPEHAEAPHAALSLYDLERDREERVDLLANEVAAAAASAALARLRPALENGIAALGLAPPSTAPLDPETRRRLEALGYVGEPRR